jgi:hypothetical protein
MRVRTWLQLIPLGFMVLIGTQVSYTQDLRWLRVTALQGPVNSVGAIYEGELSGQLNINYFTWPAQYGIGLNDQNTLRMEGLWIGCKNFDDPIANKIMNVKVIASGPRNDPDRVNEIFPRSLKLVGRFPHPAVTVDGSRATLLDNYDVLEETDLTMAADRMVVVTFNTSLGISVTKKVMVFATPNDGSYFVNDYVFKNTGIYDAAGHVKQQTLDSVSFYWLWRYQWGGESYGAPAEPVTDWGYFNTVWGFNTLNHDFGNYGSGTEFNNAASPLHNMRGFYSYYGPVRERPVTYEEDWGCPAQSWDGRLGAWKYGGNVTLHADTSPQNPADDINQPSTTWFIASDLAIMQAVNQYDAPGMAGRWTTMTEGHSPQPHDVVVGNGYAEDYADARRQAGGGTSQGQGYGPYTLAPADSVHIVFAQGVNGMTREKSLEVGANWLQYFNTSGTPTLIMPDGSQAPSTLDGANAYKRSWVQSGADSVVKIFRNAMINYASGYTLPDPPPPPETFTVTSGGNRIRIEWAANADNAPHFNGYVLYRSAGTSMNPLSRYTKIFECDKANVAHSFDDVLANRGIDYYYYIQSKDDGMQNPIEPGVPLYSSLFWTITSAPAHLQRPPIPSGPIPFDTTYWKLTTSRGAYVAGTVYQAYDEVTYHGSRYVLSNGSPDTAGTPGDAGTRWRLITARGAWLSGLTYNAYDAVTYLGADYVTLYSISGGQGLDLVRIVPNPYDIRARSLQFGTLATQRDRIAFYGLPGVCQLKIFTERGDLIYEKSHTNSTGDELWNSTTSSGQVVASGIYILYVETPEGKSVIRKFVIIR